MFTSQKEYARSGKVDLLNLLTNLLIDRFKSEGHDFKTIVLNEAIQS
ncbi:LPO_1073/Vpar_1526 family protein, partial [Legionella quinlivanii]